jgi:hypothetical protein
MENRRSCADRNPRGYARRRVYRAEILASLRALCERIEKLQRSRDGRAACREVNRMLAELQERDAGKEEA